LGANGAAVDVQADQLAALVQRDDLAGGQQAAFGQLGQARDQAGHVQHQLGQAVDLALEFGMLQRRRQRLALDLVDPAAHRLAGEEAGQVAGQGAGRPQVVGLGEQTHTGQVQLALAIQRLAPAPGHVGDGLGGTGQGAMQGVLGAAVDDPLRLDALPAAERIALDQQGGEAFPAQAGVQPEAGDAAADDQDIGAEGVGHA